MTNKKVKITPNIFIGMILKYLWGQLCMPAFIGPTPVSFMGSTTVVVLCNLPAFIGLAFGSVYLIWTFFFLCLLGDPCKNSSLLDFVSRAHLPHNLHAKTQFYVFFSILMCCNHTTNNFRYHFNLSTNPLSDKMKKINSSNLTKPTRRGPNEDWA